MIHLAEDNDRERVVNLKDMKKKQNTLNALLVKVSPGSHVSSSVLYGDTDIQRIVLMTQSRAMTLQ